MRYLISTLVIALALLGTVSITHAQPHVAQSLLVHLDLDLDKSALSPTNVQVRIHATDRINDTYYASPVDPGEGDEVEWNQNLPLMVDSNLPMQLIFHLGDINGAPIPSGFAVQWQYDLNDSGYQDMTGNAVIIPANSSGDMNLTVQGTVVSQ